jgi:hypothetical protein
MLHPKEERIYRGMIVHFEAKKGYGFIRQHKPASYEGPFFFLITDLLRNKRNIDTLADRPAELIRVGQFVEFQAKKICLKKVWDNAERPRAMHVQLLDTCSSKPDARKANSGSTTQPRRGSRRPSAGGDSRRPSAGGDLRRPSAGDRGEWQRNSPNTFAPPRRGMYNNHSGHRLRDERRGSGTRDQRDRSRRGLDRGGPGSGSLQDPAVLAALRHV